MGARFDTPLRSENQPNAEGGGGAANANIQHDQQADATPNQEGRVGQETVVPDGGGAALPPEAPPPVNYRAARHIADRIAKREAREKAARDNEGIETRAADLASREQAFNSRMSQERELVLDPNNTDAYFKSRGFENGFAGFQEEKMRAEGLIAQNKDPRFDGMQAELKAMREERQLLQDEQAKAQAAAQEREEHDATMRVISSDIDASPEYASIAKSEHKAANGKSMGELFKGGVYQLMHSGNNPSTGNVWTMPEAMAHTKKTILDTGVAMLASLGHDTSAFAGETPDQAGVKPETPDQGSGTPERTTNLKQGASAEAGARVLPGAMSTIEWANRWAKQHNS